MRFSFVLEAITGQIPDDKVPADGHQKLIERHDITWKKWERARRKQPGRANLQDIRFRNFFVILASEGGGTSSSNGKPADFRTFGGYLISFRNGHAQVRIDDETCRQLKAHYVGLALRRAKVTLISEFYAAPFEPYSTVKRQMFNILWEVNRLRKVAGFEQIPSSAIWLKRRILPPFQIIPASPLAA